MYYRTCEACGAALDPGEICDCGAGQNGIALRCEQPPIIFERLDSVKENLDGKLAEVRGLPLNDESLKRVKAIRADLAKRFDTLEAQRKEVKRQVMEPYLKAEDVYKSRITDPYRAADAELKKWVDDYQGSLKGQCEKRLRAYFGEVCQANGIDFLRFEQIGVAVDMAMARQKEPAKAMEQIRRFVESVCGDMRTILTMEDAPEVLMEYRQSLNLAQSIAAVKARKQAKATAEEYAAVQREKATQTEQHRAEIMAAAPEPICPAEKRYDMTFTVNGTLPELKALKAYILSTNLILQEDNNK